MRIVHLVTRSHRRGAELVALELADELDALGHRNRVITMALAHDGSEDPDLPPLVRRRRLGVDVLLAACWQARRRLTEEPADVVIAHGGWTAQVAALALRRPTTLLAWQRILGLPPEARGRLRRVWWSAVAKRTDVGLALTQDLADELRWLGFAGPIWIIPNARRPERFADLDRPCEAARLRAELGVAPDVELIGLVGHLIEQKRPERAIAVLADLRSRGRRTHLVMAGDGPLRASLEAELDRRGLRGHASILGYRSDVEHLLGGLDLLMLTSDAEGIPGIAIEAQMAGCPIVSFPVGGIQEVVEDDATGIVLRAPDEGLMAAVLAELLDDGPRLARLSAEARRRSPRFALARTAAMYCEHLEDAHRSLLAAPTSCRDRLRRTP